MYLAIVLSVVLLILTLTFVLDGLLARAGVKKGLFLLFPCGVVLANLLAPVEIAGLTIGWPILFATVLFFVAFVCEKSSEIWYTVAGCVTLPALLFLLKYLLGVDENAWPELVYIEAGVTGTIIALLASNAVSAACLAYFSCCLCTVMSSVQSMILHIGNVSLASQTTAEKAMLAAVIALFAADLMLYISSRRRERKTNRKEAQQKTGKLEIEHGIYDSRT